jgi:hypothetical protein
MPALTALMALLWVSVLPASGLSSPVFKAYTEEAGLYALRYEELQEAGLEVGR